MESGWFDEMRCAYLYREIADLEKGTRCETLFRDLAREAEAQAAIWAGKFGEPVSGFRPDLRARIVVALLRRFGPRALRGVLAAMKVRGLSIYTHSVPGHRVPTSIEDVESRHKGMGTGGNLLAATSALAFSASI